MEKKTEETKLDMESLSLDDDLSVSELDRRLELAAAAQLASWCVVQVNE
jgi:hypothetical protein